jgi:hypothetical protein
MSDLEAFIDELGFWHGQLMLIVTSYPGMAEQGPMPAPAHLRPALVKGPVPFVRMATDDELMQYLEDNPPPPEYGSW